MGTIVELPRLSDTMEEGVVATWRIAEGDKVKRGQVIAEIETDKATMEFESFDSGFVLRLIAAEGDALPIGAPIAVLGKKDEDADEILAARTGATASIPAANATGQTTELSVPEAAPAVADSRPPVDGDRRIPASPMARRLAREAGFALHQITGSGPHGRVVRADVEKKVAAADSEVSTVTAGHIGDEVDADGRPFVSRSDKAIRHSPMRKTIVKRMVESKTHAPHFYLSVDIDMQRAAELRSQYNAAIEGKVSFNDIVILAVAKSLRHHPEVNAHYTPEANIRCGEIHVGVAVAVDDGLIVPVVRHADQRSLESIGLTVRDLAGRAREKTLAPEQMSGSTFSVSNLGMFGIESFSAVINPGEGAILAVGAVEDRAVVVEGKIEVRKRMKCTMSCDHRVVDGAMGAKWLQTLRSYLENPMRMFT